MRRLLDLLLDDDVAVRNAAAQAIADMSRDHLALFVDAVRMLVSTWPNPAGRPRSGRRRVVQLWLVEDARAALDASTRLIFDDLLGVSDFDALTALLGAEDGTSRGGRLLGARVFPRGCR